MFKCIVFVQQHYQATRWISQCWKLTEFRLCLADHRWLIHRNKLNRGVTASVGPLGEWGTGFSIWGREEGWSGELLVRFGVFVRVLMSVFWARGGCGPTTDSSRAGWWAIVSPRARMKDILLFMLEKKSGHQPTTQGTAKHGNRDWDGSLQALVSSAPLEVSPAPSAFPGASFAPRLALQLFA